MAEGKAATAAVGGIGLGVFAGFAVDPEQGFALLKWLNESIGAVGFVAILTLGAGLAVSVTGNWLMWNRLKEKDQECREETGNQRLAWKAVVEKLEAKADKDQENTKELAETVAEMLTQVTLLAERARVAGMRTRSS